MRYDHRKPEFPFGQVTNERPQRILGLRISELATETLTWMLAVSIDRRCFLLPRAFRMVAVEQQFRLAHGR